MALCAKAAARVLDPPVLPRVPVAERPDAQLQRGPAAQRPGPGQQVSHDRDRRPAQDQAQRRGTLPRLPVPGCRTGTARWTAAQGSPGTGTGTHRAPAARAGREKALNGRASQHLGGRPQRLLPVAEPERASRQPGPRRDRVTEPAQRDRLRLLGRQVIQPADRIGQPTQQVRLALPAPPVDHRDPQSWQRREHEVGKVRPLRVTIENIRRLVQHLVAQPAFTSSTVLILTILVLENHAARGRLLQSGAGSTTR